MAKQEYLLLFGSPLLGQVDRLGGLVVIAPARRAGDPGSIPGAGENFFSTTYQMVILKAKFSSKLAYLCR